MWWIILIITIVALLGYFRNKEEQHKQDLLLKNPEYRTSVFKQLVEDEYQQYLLTSLTAIKKYKDERERLLSEGNKKEAKTRDGNIRFENEFIKLLKETKLEYDKNKSNMFSNLLNCDTTEEAREEISDYFSSNASTALARSVK